MPTYDVRPFSGSSTGARHIQRPSGCLLLRPPWPWRTAEKREECRRWPNWEKRTNYSLSGWTRCWRRITGLNSSAAPCSLRESPVSTVSPQPGSIPVDARGRQRRRTEFATSPQRQRRQDFHRTQLSPRTPEEIGGQPRGPAFALEPRPADAIRLRPAPSDGASAPPRGSDHRCPNETRRTQPGPLAVHGQAAAFVALPRNGVNITPGFRRRPATSCPARNGRLCGTVILHA